LLVSIPIRIVLAPSWIRILIRNDEKSWFCNEAIAIPNTANKEILIRIRRIQTTAIGLAFICGTYGTVFKYRKTSLETHLECELLQQCSGSMKFWGGSGSPRIHEILGWIRILGSKLLTNGSGSWIRILLFMSLTFKMPAKNKFNTIFSAYYFLKVHLHHFSKIISQKESQNRRNQGFSYYFCMMKEGSGSGARVGSIPLTSGSGRPKNMWIRNTAIQPFFREKMHLKEWRWVKTKNHKKKEHTYYPSKGPILSFSMLPEKTHKHF
jgi:hypothetical protein